VESARLLQEAAATRALTAGLLWWCASRLCVSGAMARRMHGIRSTCRRSSPSSRRIGSRRSWVRWTDTTWSWSSFKVRSSGTGTRTRTNSSWSMEVPVVLFEPASTVNTGDVQSEL